MFGEHEDCGCVVEYRHFTFEMVDSAGRPAHAPFAKLLSCLWGENEERIDVSPKKLEGASFKDFLQTMDMAISLKLPHGDFPGPLAAPEVLRLLGRLMAISRIEERHEDSLLPDERLLKAKSIIEGDQKGELSIDSLAKRVGMSRTHFMRSFRNAFGDTPMHFSRSLRLARARDLFAEGWLKERTIAAETGFCDEFHLSKQFKAEYGETPSAFRRRIGIGRT